MNPDILTIFDQLTRAGIWLYLDDNDVLTVGPETLVHRHPDLLQLVRDNKPAVIHTVKSLQVYAFFRKEAGDTRFEKETCPFCRQSIPIMTAPRRLGTHRLKDNRTVCPESERAQLVTAEAILSAFIQDRCVPSPSAVLTWTSLKGALLAWCAEREFWLPPPQYLQQWLSERYKKFTGIGGPQTLGPLYEGLQLRQEEWLGDEEAVPDAVKPGLALAKALGATPVLVRKKPTLVATGKANTATTQEALL